VVCERWFYCLPPRVASVCVVDVVAVVVGLPLVLRLWVWLLQEECAIGGVAAGAGAAAVAGGVVARTVFCEMEMPFDVVHVRVRGVEWCVADGITSSRGHTSAYMVRGPDMIRY
jgi:hypothetical protein